jgi:hypothetical protein
MPAPTTQTSALVFLSNVDDRMIEAVATQTESVLRRLDSRFRAVLFLEGRLKVFFFMIGNRLRESAPIRGPHQKMSGPQLRVRIWRPGQLPKSVKLQRPARATVCSHSLRDATASVDVILNKYPPRRVVKSARRAGGTDGTNEQLARPDAATVSRYCLSRAEFSREIACTFAQAPRRCERPWLASMDLGSWWQSFKGK